MTSRLDKMMTYGIGRPCTKSHDSLGSWLYAVSWQIKNISQNSTSPMDIKFDRVVAYDLRPKL